MSASRTRLVYVASAMHSGSTALSLLLHQHPEIVATSQPEWLSDYARDATTPCSCGCAISSCPFWRRVAAGFAQLAGKPFDPSFAHAHVETAGSWALRPDESLAHAAILASGSLPLLRTAARRVDTLAWNLQAAEENLRLFEAVRLAAERPLVVDASKIPSRGKLLYLRAPEQTRLIWLVRDGRAHAWSRAQRSGVSFAHAVAAWVRAQGEIAALFASIPRRHWLLVRHEDVCADPAHELARIFRFLGLAACEVSRQLGNAPAHLVGGNEMRYRAQQEILTLDERWKRALTPSQRTTFELLAGWLQRRLGYRDEL